MRLYKEGKFLRSVRRRRPPRRDLFEDFRLTRSPPLSLSLSLSNDQLGVEGARVLAASLKDLNGLEELLYASSRTGRVTRLAAPGSPRSRLPHATQSEQLQPRRRGRHRHCGRAEDVHVDPQALVRLLSRALSPPEPLESTLLTMRLYLLTPGSTTTGLAPVGRGRWQRPSSSARPWSTSSACPSPSSRFSAFPL